MLGPSFFDTHRIRMRGSATSYYSRKYTIATPGTYAYILVGCMLCWITGYIYSVGYPVYGEVTASPLWNAICRVLPGKAFTYLIGLLLMAGGAFLLHRANYALVLIREKTLLPFVFYILFISTNPDFMPLKSASVGVFCLVLAIYQLFTSYHNPEAVGNAYNAALILGIGSLLWIHILWFIPLFWFGMYNFRSLNIRTLAASFLGVGTVYWFVFGWCVWQNDFTAFTLPFSTLFKIRFLMIDLAGWLDWIGVAYLVLLAVAASLNIVLHEYEDNLRTRQFLSFLIALTIWIFGLFVLYEQSSEELLEMVCMPVSILLAHFFTVLRGKYIFWLFHFTVVLFIALLFIRLWSSL